MIDIFQINIRSAQARHIRTFKHGLVHAPNAIHLLGDGKMFITNNHYIRAKTSPLLAKIETFSGIPGGTVVYTDINSPSSTKVVARVGFANGITMLSYKGTKTLAVASSSKPGVYFYTVKDDWDLEYKNWIRTPAGADNLSVDMNGKLLLAGHPYAPALMEVAKGRAQCDEEGSEVEKKACGCWAPSWAGEWSKEGGLKTLLLDDANGKKGVCSSSTVVRDVKRGVGVISMLYGKGLVVFKE